MDLQPIEDTNDDCPEYGGPDVGIPPDFRAGIASTSTAMPKTWHCFPWIKEKLWPITTGKGIKVAVLDTGYNKHDYGPEPIAARSFVKGESWADGHAHDSHCIGTVLCRRDENGDSIGMAPDADLIVGKVLSNSGSGGSDGITQGIVWAVDQGAAVISMSLGSGSSYGPTNEAIDYAWSKGCITVCAAGNDGYRGANTINWPGKYQNAICVGSYSKNGQISSFSSGGREIDVACPGEEITSFHRDGKRMQLMSGTSMATPGMGGRTALLESLRRAQGLPVFRSAEEFLEYCRGVLVDAGEPGFDVRFGIGIPEFDFVLKALILGLTGA